MRTNPATGRERTPVEPHYNSAENMYAGNGVVPVPDPTKLTTDAVRAATEQWRRDLESVREIIETRLHAMDTATSLNANIAVETSRSAHQEVENLRTLHTEKFKATYEHISAESNVLLEKFDSIELQFKERDVRTDQAARTSADALAAALQAAKELVNAQGEASAAAAVKSETSFTKQIDQIGTIIQTLEKALDARITELKERIDRGEGTTRGRDDARTEKRLDTGQVVAIIGAILLSLSVATVIIINVFHTNTPTTTTPLVPCATASAGESCVK